MIKLSSLVALSLFTAACSVNNSTKNLSSDSPEFLPITASPSSIFYQAYYQNTPIQTLPQQPLVKEPPMTNFLLQNCETVKQSGACAPPNTLMVDDSRTIFR